MNARYVPRVAARTREGLGGEVVPARARRRAWPPPRSLSIGSVMHHWPVGAGQVRLRWLLRTESRPDQEEDAD